MRVFVVFLIFKNYYYSGILISFIWLQMEEIKHVRFLFHQQYRTIELSVQLFTTISSLFPIQEASLKVSNLRR